MSSKYLTIIPAVAAILLGTGCSNDDMDGVLADGPVAAQVTADISSGQAVSRASIDGNSASFTEDDVIHVVAGGSAYDYTLQSDGTWTAATPYYFQDFSSVSFRGWYATSTVAETETVTETDAGTESSISIDTSAQTTDSDSGWNAWDILATPEVSAYAISPTVNFIGINAFQHVMSQVTFTFTAGDGASDLEALKGYTLKNLITDAAFDTQACELAAGSTTGDITQSVSATSETTELACTPIILVPQDVDGKLTLEVTYNDLVYTAELSLPSSATALTAGTHYTFTVSIDNTGLTIGSATIETWTTIADRAGEATFDSIDYALTEENGITTYTVYTEAGLLAWSEYARDGNWATNCTLAADITLTEEWIAVGYKISFSNYRRYTGTFDGNGHTITNLTISSASDECQALIGCLGSGGVVKNLTLENVNILVSSSSFFGAVVGHNYYGTVTGCSVSGTVSGYSNIGGVVGFNYGTVTDCSFSGEVRGTDVRVGGVVGYNSSIGSVIGCYSTGSVTGSGQYTGGVAGYNGCIVTACYTSCTVQGSTYTGGVAGYNYGTVTACYATGTVTSTGNYTGGVVGYNNTSNSGSVKTCYWYNSTTSYGIGEPESDDNATKVEGDVTWQSAATAMNAVLTDWQYEVNSDTSGAPLILKEVTE